MNIGTLLLKVPIYSVTDVVTFIESNKKLPDHWLSTIWSFSCFSLCLIHFTVNGNEKVTIHSKKKGIRTHR
jgi:hypothetical protein